MRAFNHKRMDSTQLFLLHEQFHHEKAFLIRMYFLYKGIFTRGHFW
jgi:hypothetical protein